MLTETKEIRLRPNPFIWRKFIHRKAESLRNLFYSTKNTKNQWFQPKNLRKYCNNINEDEDESYLCLYDGKHIPLIPLFPYFVVNRYYSISE
ncbi:hypothetical protein RIR_jg34041.t1 [Rhizophagus irregularis DAOM 181602=DAOM 197198]|uniref:Uncharacterized protein n=1 Tax=Rhizophagus irregularis (strain DAOM 181602 / DAOM 197198 / MUCL 43194) TaxID=747089 RepID=U9U6X0_RHIID|nr:hypothetical protein RIR_jg34041.t1 [Rhizophagus irregularis DAOM 181602=DAOM 197198]